nr:hypothetical membrane protein [uncultured archaeon]
MIRQPLIYCNHPLIYSFPAFIISVISPSTTILSGSKKKIRRWPYRDIYIILYSFSYSQCIFLISLPISPLPSSWLVHRNRKFYFFRSFSPFCPHFIAHFFG